MLVIALAALIDACGQEGTPFSTADKPWGVVTSREAISWLVSSSWLQLEGEGTLSACESVIDARVEGRYKSPVRCSPGQL